MHKNLDSWMKVKQEIALSVDNVQLAGDLHIPEGAKSLVVFVHGSGSSRHSPRNQYVANFLNRSGHATLLFDLLTASEEAIDIHTGDLRFDIPFLARRVVAVTESLMVDKRTGVLKIGYFGASTGAAAALVAAAQAPDLIWAVVSRGGRPDLAGSSLARVQAPTLLIVGQNDREVIRLNEQALSFLPMPKAMKIVPGASHLFSEPGTLEQAAQLACNWFDKYLLAGST